MASANSFAYCAGFPFIRMRLAVKRKDRMYVPLLPGYKTWTVGLLLFAWAAALVIVLPGGRRACCGAARVVRNPRHGLTGVPVLTRLRSLQPPCLTWLSHP